MKIAHCQPECQWRCHWQTTPVRVTVPGAPLSKAPGPSRPVAQPNIWAVAHKHLAPGWGVLAKISPTQSEKNPPTPILKNKLAGQLAGIEFGGYE
jgi:hypothetical protein